MIDKQTANARATGQEEPMYQITNNYDDGVRVTIEDSDPSACERKLRAHAQRRANRTGGRVTYCYRHLGSTCTACGPDGLHRDYRDPL